MSVVMEPVQEFLDAFMNERVVHNVVLPVLQLVRGRQFAVKQQVRRLEVIRFLGQFFDRVTPVPQYSRVSVDIGYAADTRRGVVEGRVVAHHSEFRRIHLDLPKITRADGVVGDGNLVGLSGAVVRNREGVALCGFGVARFQLRRWECRVHANTSEKGRAVGIPLYTKETQGGMRVSRRDALAAVEDIEFEGDKARASATM